MEYNEKLTAYRTAMSLAKGMLTRAIISEEEYRKIDTIMTKKYGISSTSIYC